MAVKWDVLMGSLGDAAMDTYKLQGDRADQAQKQAAAKAAEIRANQQSQLNTQLAGAQMKNYESIAAQNEFENKRLQSQDAALQQKTKLDAFDAQEKIKNDAQYTLTLGDLAQKNNKFTKTEYYPQFQSAIAGMRPTEASKIYSDYLESEKALKLEGVKQAGTLKKDSAKENKENFTQEQQLRTQFGALSKDFLTIRDAKNKIDVSAKNPSPQGDLAIIYNYMKMLDPTSVVRESEFATAASTGAYGDRIQAAILKPISGQRLDDSIRKGFLNSTTEIYNTQKGSFDSLKNKYSKIAESYGLSPDRVISGFDTIEQQSTGQENLTEIKSKSGKTYTF